VPLGGGDNAGIAFEGHCPLKICEGKNFQKSAQFRTAYDFNREYLWNGARCQKL